MGNENLQHISFSSEAILSANLLDYELKKKGHKAFLTDMLSVVLYLKAKGLNHIQFKKEDVSADNLRAFFKGQGIDNYTINKVLYGYNNHPGLFYKVFTKSIHSNRVLNLKSGKGFGIHFRFYFSDKKISDNELNRGLDKIKPGVFIQCDEKGNFNLREIKEALKEIPFFMDVYRAAVTGLYECNTRSDQKDFMNTPGSWIAANDKILSVKKSVRTLMLQEGCCIQTAERRKKKLSKFFDINFSKDEVKYKNVSKDQLEKLFKDSKKNPFEGIIIAKSFDNGRNSVIFKKSDVFVFGTKRLYSFRKVSSGETKTILDGIKDQGVKLATIKKMVKEDSYWIPASEIRDHIFFRNSTKEKNERFKERKMEYTRSKISQIDEVYVMNELLITINNDLRNKDSLSYAVWLDSDSHISDIWMDGMDRRILEENDFPTIYHDRDNESTVIGNMEKRRIDGRMTYFFKGMKLEKNNVLPEFPGVSVETWNEEVDKLKKRIKNILKSAYDVIDGKMMAEIRKRAPERKTAKTTEFHTPLYTPVWHGESDFVKAKKAQEYYASKKLDELNIEAGTTTEMFKNKLQEIIRNMMSSGMDVKSSFDEVKLWLYKGIEGAKEIHTREGKKQHKINVIALESSKWISMDEYSNKALEAFYNYIKIITRVLPYYIWLDEIQTRSGYDMMVNMIKREREVSKVSKNINQIS